MASVSSLYFLSQTPCFTAVSNKPNLHNSDPNPNIFVAPNSSRRRKEHVLCCKQNYYSSQEEREPFCCCLQGTKRREALLNMAFTALTFPAIVSDALAENEVAANFRVYTDDVNKFQISIPQEWQIGAGDPNGFNSVTAFYPGEASCSNVSVVITGLSPDFTRLESFGKVDAFAETLVGGLDRSWQRPPGVAAKLIDCKAANALGIAFNGWYNRLYTVTGQFVDEESEKYGSNIQKAVSSFKFI